MPRSMICVVGLSVDEDISWQATLDKFKKDIGCIWMGYL
jgi:hypothetical protein